MRFKNCQSQLFVKKILNEIFGPKIEDFQENSGTVFENHPKMSHFQFYLNLKPQCPQNGPNIRVQTLKIHSKCFLMRLF